MPHLPRRSLDSGSGRSDPATLAELNVITETMPERYRAVVHVDERDIVSPPKSAAGVRAVATPPHVLPVPQVHLRVVAGGRSALLFPSERDRKRTLPGR